MATLPRGVGTTDVNALPIPTLAIADTIDSAISTKQLEPDTYEPMQEASASVSDIKACLHKTCQSVTDDAEPMLEAQKHVSEVPELVLNMPASFGVSAAARALSNDT